MCVWAKRRDRAVAERKARVLAELVEAVLRRHAQRHARQRSGELAVDVGVHEMRVEDPRPSAREIRRRAAGTRTGRRPPQAESSRAVCREPSARAQSPRRPARARAASGSGRPSPAPSAAAAVRADAPPSPRSRPPSAGAGRFRSDSPRRRQDSVGPRARPNAARATRSRSVRPISARSLSSSPANQRRRVGEALRRVALEEQRIAVEQLVEHGIGREHRQARRRSFVDDLVRRSRLHVVDEDVRRARTAPGPARAARVAERDAELARARCDAAARARSARRRAAGRRRPRPAATARGGSSRSPSAGE